MDMLAIYLPFVLAKSREGLDMNPIFIKAVS